MISDHHLDVFIFYRSENIVFRKETYLDNEDRKNPEYNTKYGMYEKNCGIENLMMSWGHDVSVGTYRKI